MALKDLLSGWFGGRKEEKKEKLQYALVNGIMPVFTQFGEDIFASDVVANALHTIARETSKCIVKSVRETYSPHKVTVQQDEITTLFRTKPNPLMTAQEFFYKVSWLRVADRNAFIYPMYEFTANGDRKYTGFFPLRPLNAIFMTDTRNNLFICFQFANGENYILPYEDIIHLRYDFTVNDVLGGNMNGGPDNRDTLKTAAILDKAMQGLPKAIEASLQLKGVYTSKTVVDAEAIKKERDKFEDHIMSSKAGIVALDLAGDFTPINIAPTVIDHNILEYLENKLLKRYGVSMAIITGKYTDDEYAAFYQTCIEDFIIQFQQAATACCYPKTKIEQGYGVKVYDRLIQNMSMDKRLKIVELMGPPGDISHDERRELVGYEPDGGPNRVSLNFVDASIANQYQSKSLQKGDTKKDE